MTAAAATATPPPATATQPSPTATPDPLGPRPKDGDEARRVLSSYLATVSEACPDQLRKSWQAMCVEGDFDGDGRKDTGYLVPLDSPAGRSAAPAAVLVRRAATSALERFPRIGGADAGDLGRSLFAADERTGDQQDELSYLATTCGASGCTSRVEVQSWDGTAWRDVGPGDAGVDNIDRATIVGKGVDTRITLHGGLLGSAGAGPTRAVTTTYGWDVSRYRAISTVPDKPVYLFHGIQDADRRFAALDFVGAATAYRAAIADPTLADWQQEMGKGNGRRRLTAYALFRIAVATAASGADPGPAIDAAITGAQEPVFVNATVAFRKGFQERDGVHGGCIEATLYLTGPGIAEYLREVFDYGYANLPQKTARDLCPL
ncbi:MAG: hypothetical protein HYX53_08120 [Chloroflexi bacterium]|nr:hypothetical protein [Chloroflexota bacterium]